LLRDLRNLREREKREARSEKAWDQLGSWEKEKAKAKALKAEGRICCLLRLLVAVAVAGMR
jgi:hypothetical protein